MKILNYITVIILLVLNSVVFFNGCTHKEPQKKLQEESTQIIKDVSLGEFQALIKKYENNENAVLLDVRRPEEFADEHIKNAENLDYYSDIFEENLAKLDKNKIYLVYCRSGNRSGKTLKIMQEMNFIQAYNLLGGIIEWKARKLPLVK